MFKKKKRKFCPKCGVELKIDDKYCTSCGYSFEKRKKKINLKKVIIAAAILVVLWIAIRLILGKPIIPSPLTDIFKNVTG